MSPLSTALTPRWRRPSACDGSTGPTPWTAGTGLAPSRSRSAQPSSSVSATSSAAAVEPVEQDAVPHARGIRRLCGLERHEPAVGGDDGVRRLAAFVVVEVREPHEVLPRAVEPQLPDVDVAGSAYAAERLDLAVRLDARVLTVGKDALDLVVGARRFREVGDRLRLQIDAHDRGEPLWLVTGEGQLAVVVVEILRLDRAAAVRALVDHRLVAERRRAVVDHDVGDHEPRPARLNLGHLRVHLR